jgi:hypothetical protein
MAYAYTEDVNSDSDGPVEDHFLGRRGDKPVWEGTTMV